MLDPRAFLINNKTGRVVATTFIEFLSGNSTTPSICFTDSPDSGLQCDSNGVVNYIKNGVNQGEIAASLGLGTLNDLANSSYDLTGNGSVSSLDATEFMRGMTPKGDIALLNASGNAGLSFLAGDIQREVVGSEQLSGSASLFIKNDANPYCDAYVNLGINGVYIGGQEIWLYLTSANGSSAPSPVFTANQNELSFWKDINLTAADEAKYSNIPGGTTGQVLTKSSGTDYDASWSDLTVSDVFIIACSDETSDLAAGTDKARFTMPYAGTLTAVKADVNTAPTGSTLVVDINEAGTSVLSTKLSIDAGETSSSTAATPPVISDSALANGAVVSIDIDQIGSTVAGAGLKVTLYVTRS